MKIILSSFFVLSFQLASAQFENAFFTHQQLLKIPVEAAYYLNKKDEYSLGKFLQNEIKLKYNSEYSSPNFIVYDKVLEKSWEFDKSVITFSLIVDKRTQIHLINTLYIKNKNNSTVVDNSFYDYLISHPKAIKFEQGIALLIGNSLSKEMKDQKVVIGIIPNYLSDSLQYQVLIMKNDNTLSLEQILTEIYF
ncbi:hypothetical protein [Aquirufa ecclesiirivi]|uniref:hypothetical protein n=1 Tax=Aquirufa ecclesiirivi TaxID=2715124 RepID=UPI0023D87906|nr:hypothetical protein [Aquirufa ecclesiirivi]MDF0693199.1 hypothetical protein [Aquirufa ecclesiirivi]